MSTTIKSNEPTGVRTASLRHSSGGDSVIVNDYVRVPRADFLAAVETECGVIVIDKATLPEVTGDVQHGGGARWVTFADGRSRGILAEDEHYDRALAHLAVVEYRKTHPPIDEAQVEALAVDLFGARWPGKPWELRADPQQQDYRTMARTLLAAGWTRP